MTNHHSRASEAEETYGIVLLLAGVSVDDITAEQAVKNADTEASARPFERGVGLADHVAIKRTIADIITIADIMPWAAEGANQKILLPRRTGALQFSPQQYYYGASKSGVVPSWAISAGVHPA